MLIPAQKLMQELERQRVELAVSTLANPPDDYAKFMLAVGRYRELQDLQTTVSQMARQEDN